MDNPSSSFYQPYVHLVAPNSKLRDLIAKGQSTESHVNLTGMKIHHLCVKLLTSMHCNGLNEKW